MEPKRLFVDLDGTLARFHDEANYLEHMYERNFFYNLKPFENMISGINTFIQDHPDVKVYTITACIDSPYCRMDKNRWIDRQQINIPQNQRIYTEVGKPKSNFIPGGIAKNDYLLDDYNKSLNQFLYDGGSAIKCHNNINQQGLGAHGGMRGNLWIGPMVHVNDTPELIAAELAQHMELEYDLNKVIKSYRNILLVSENLRYIKGKGSLEEREGQFLAKEALNGGIGHIFHNPLNAIRFLSGDDAFLEHNAKTHTGQVIREPAFRLQAITTNLYDNPDFFRFLCADHAQFAEDVVNAMADAQSAIVGQTQRLFPNGVGDIVTYQDISSMEAEITECYHCDQPVSVTWFVPHTDKPLCEIMDNAELETRLMYDHEVDSTLVKEVTNAILTPAHERTTEQSELLTDIWINYPIPGSLPQFLRTQEEASTVTQSKTTEGLSFESVLFNALERANAQVSPGDSVTPKGNTRGGEEI